ncbi:hypothetical protein TcWFU_008887 [Taenia crassiceps]|uniref:Uncharacterized protein n=1 Tax=Taenia crassiceps TaxID=6207 RepID=A0ABR4QTC1_9CEST
MTQNLRHGLPEARESELASSTTKGLIIGGSIVGGSVALVILIICCCCSVRSQKSSNVKVVKPAKKQTGGRMELDVVEESVCKEVSNETEKRGKSYEGEAALDLPGKRVRFSCEDDKKAAASIPSLTKTSPVAKPIATLPSYAKIREGETSPFYSNATP